MNRRDFGELLSALRQDLGWTQFQLAEYADTDVSVVSQIERGVKRHFDPDLLFQLVNALQLTTLERFQFLLAASGLDQDHIVRQPSAATSTDVFDVKRVLEKMVELTGRVRLPAFLADVYGDIIAANNIIVALFKPPPEFVEEAGRIPAGFNSVRMNFSKDLVARSRVLDNWDRYAVYSMRSFRENSLRYRARPYFKYLMSIFRNQNEYPLFERYWKMVSSIDEDKESTADYFAYRHAEYGQLQYVASSTISITSFGELFLIHYLPLDEQTGQVFEALAQQAGQGVRTFAPWPEKPMP